MGAKKEIKLLILIGVFLCTCIFLAYSQKSQPQSTGKTPPLKQFLGQIPGYTTIGDVKLGADAFNMLKLDDYLFANYANKDGKVNLYVGYYYSANKAYAAHSPLVCYPSNGWKIDRTPIRHSLNIGPNVVTYEEIVTSYGEEQELVLYWFQSRAKTNIQVYKNKIDMGYNKLFFNDTKHGFVRVSTPFAGSNYEEARKKAISFTEAFYPHLLEYVTH